MVERFTPWDFLNGADADVLSCEDGRFVDFSDYEALERENAKLRAELKLAIAEREFWRLADKNSVERAEVAEADRAELRAEVERLTPLAVAYDYLEAPPVVPSGMVLVPVEPTNKQIEAGKGAYRAARLLGDPNPHGMALLFYRSMLTAAQEGR